MARVYLALGSNTGDKKVFLKEALDRINSHPDLTLVAVSPVYETLPYGVTDQGEFLNMAAAVDSGIPPFDLLAELKLIERQTGRVARKRWYEREIDIDILLYDDLVLRAETLNIPHIELEKRDFFTVPLLDIEPGVRSPVSGIFLRDLKITLEKPYIKGLSRFFFELRNGLVVINEQ